MLNLAQLRVTTPIVGGYFVLSQRWFGLSGVFRKEPVLIWMILLIIFLISWLGYSRKIGAVHVRHGFLYSQFTTFLHDTAISLERGIGIFLFIIENIQNFLLFLGQFLSLLHFLYFPYVLQARLYFHLLLHLILQTGVGAFEVSPS